MTKINFQNLDLYHFVVFGCRKNKGKKFIVLLFDIKNEKMANKSTHQRIKRVASNDWRKKILSLTKKRNYLLRARTNKSKSRWCAANKTPTADMKMSTADSVTNLKKQDESLKALAQSSKVSIKLKRLAFSPSSDLSQLTFNTKSKNIIKLILARFSL